MGNSRKQILLIGGHGQVAQIATSKIVGEGTEVTSLIRNPNHSSDIESLGATPLERDVTGMDSAAWDRLLPDFDLVIWSAGAGGKGDDSTTYAVDRDAAMAVVDSLERLAADGKAPDFIMVSYIGSLTAQLEEGATMYAYSEAKKAVDQRLDRGVDFNYVVVAPATLSDDNITTFELIDEDEGARERYKKASKFHTARDLVAAVLAELSGRDSLPKTNRLAFVDGDTPVDEIGR